MNKCEFRLVKTWMWYNTVMWTKLGSNNVNFFR